MMSNEQFICLLWSVVDEYNKPLAGISYDLYYTSFTSPDILFKLTYLYNNGGGAITYKREIPKFWITMSDKFIRKEFHIMIRNTIKESLATELEKMFGGRFNPL